MRSVRSLGQRWEVPRERQRLSKPGRGVDVSFVFRLFDLTPRPRHSEGFGGLYDVLVALSCLLGGIGALDLGHLWGFLLLAFAPYEVREAYLKYLAGNWP